MTIFTRSTFYYGHTITQTNRNLDFKEGSTVKTTQVRVGGYSLTGFANEVSRALNLRGDQDYTVNVNRATRAITITSGANFELLPVTGPTSGESVFSLLGFSTDQTGASTYTGEPSGSEFTPQLRLQDYTDFERDQDSVNALVNTTASGRVEAVTFGNNKFMTCNIRYQTNKKTGFMPFVSDAVEQLITFLEYCVTKAPLEFMQDTADRTTFKQVVLDRTNKSSTGTGFRLTESNNTPGFYDTGRLVFRERVQ